MEEEDTELDTAAGPELVSLDEVEAEETDKDIPIDGVEIEDDIAEEDDTFLEEEEEGDDDVADLIDGDIEDDEEPLSDRQISRDVELLLKPRDHAAIERHRRRSGAAGAPSPARKFGAIAQLGERFNGIQEVVGSIPSGSTISPRLI